MHALLRFSPVRLASLLILALLTLPLPAAAGVGVWTPLGPEGGSIWALAVDPADPDVVYAGTDHGMFKSTDGGETWTVISHGLGAAGDRVRAILIRPDAVYIGTEVQGIFKSTDGGATWILASNGVPPVLPGNGPSVGSLLTDPRQPNRIWAGARRGLFSTTNGGATWTTRFKGDPFDNPVLGIAIDPVNGQIFISSSRRGVYTSTNQGKKWTKVSRNLLGISYFDLVLDPANRSVLHVGTSTGLWRSDNRGASWQRVPALGNRSVMALVYQGSRLYAGASGLGFFYSDDQGRTWTRISESPDGSFILDLAAGQDILYAGTLGDGSKGAGVFRSRDGGATWERAGNGIDSLQIDLVAVAPADPDLLYASNPTGIFRSTDRGGTWQLLDAPPLLFVGFASLLVDPSDPPTLYGRRGRSLYRSRDGGDSWDEAALPLFPDDLESDPRAAGAVWAAGFLDIIPGTSVVYHSDDFGDTWEPVPFPGGAYAWIRAFEVDPKDPQVLWAAGAVFEPRPQSFRVHLRVHRSADGGQTWQRRDSGIDVPLGTTVIDLAIDPADSNRVYAGTEQGLYRTTDAGLSWTRVPGFAAEVREVEAAAATATTPGAVYAHLSGFGIQRTTDGGATWAPVRNGLEQLLVTDLAVDPTDPRRLYVGTTTRGVFTYTEPGN